MRWSAFCGWKWGKFRGALQRKTGKSDMMEIGGNVWYNGVKGVLRHVLLEEAR